MSQLRGYELWKCAGQKKENIILLHGMGGIGRVWRPVAAALEDSYSLLAPDQTGHGKSRSTDLSPKDFTPLAMAEDVLATMTDTEMYPAWIIGHSMGVRTACALAHLRPMWVRGLILVDLGITKEPGSAIVDPLVDFIKSLPTSFADRKEMREVISKTAPDPSYTPFLIAVAERNSEGRLILPFEAKSLIEIHKQARGGPFELWLHEAAQAGMKVLTLRGGQSGVLTKEVFEKERKLFAKYPNFVFEEFEEAGHGLPFEMRARFTDRVREFIAG